MQIAVWQFMRPNGRQVVSFADDMPDSLDPIVHAINKLSLKITAEVLTTGEVSFAISCDKYAADYDIEIAQNGPGENGTKAVLTRLLERFDKTKFKAWLRDQRNSDDGLGVGWGN